MKLKCVVSVLLFLWCLALSLGEDKRSADGSEQLDRPRKERKGKPLTLPTKGSLTTKDNHACSWNVSGGEELTLQVSCSHRGGRYRCRYTARPQSCLAYKAKALLYWKQAIGKATRKKHACEGEEPLKSRVCRKAPAEAHMRLRGEDWDNLENAGRSKSQRKEPLSTDTLFEKYRGKSTKARDASGVGDRSDGEPVLREELSHVYCADKWHSLCSFFVNLWNGYSPTHGVHSHTENPSMHP